MVNVAIIAIATGAFYYESCAWGFVKILPLHGVHPLSCTNPHLYARVGVGLDIDRSVHYFCKD